MDLSRLKEINEKNAQLSRDKLANTEQKLSNIQLQETVVKVARSVVDFIESNTTKTVVLNQIEDFATHQDAEQFTASIDSLHETLKTHENVDITPVVEVMKNVLDEIKRVPKEHPKQEKQKFVDYSKSLDILSKGIKDVEKAVKAQKTTVQAPSVNVEAPIVEVEAPDLKPFAKEIDKAFEKAVKKIKIPEPAKLTALEKLQKEQNKLLKNLIKTIQEMPLGGGSEGLNLPQVISTETGQYALAIANSDGSAVSGGGGTTDGPFDFMDGTDIDFMDGNAIDFMST